MAKKSKKKSTKAYWPDLLKNANTSFNLWVEHQNSTQNEPSQKKTYASEKTKLNSSLLTRLKKLADIYHTSLNTLFVTAYAILLQRYSTQEDFTFGILHSSQTTQLMPVKIHVSDKIVLKEFIKKLHLQLKKSEVALADLDWKAFNTLEPFSFTLAFKKKSVKTKLKSKSVHPTLTLRISEKSPYTFEWIYIKNQFSTTTIQTLLTHFLLILERLAINQDQLVTHFSILTDNESRKISSSWSKPADLYTIPREVHTIHHLFSKQAQFSPKRLAVQDSDRILTYKDVYELSNQLAGDLIQKGVKANDPVAVIMDRNAATIVVMLAIFKIGAIYVPINPKYPDERIEFVLEDCSPSLIIVDKEAKLPKLFSNKGFLLQSDVIQPKSHYESTPINPPSLSSEQVAYIIYTSGTTGQPKGVMIKHLSLVNLAYFYRHFFNVNEKDRSSQFASQGFDSYFCETIPFLAWGASIHVVDDQTKLSPNLFLPWLRDQQITVCDLPTAYAQLLFPLKWPTPFTLRLMKIGGEAVTRYPQQNLTFDIWNGYGPTEATVEATYMQIYEANTPYDSANHKPMPPPIGKPITHYEVHIVDKYLQPVPIGVAGELLIGGLGLSSGYLNRPQLTRDKFIRNIFSRNTHEKLYRTGDLARWLEDGNIEFIGRIDTQVKISGYRIELNEIQALLNQYTDVQDVIVIARDAGAKKALIAYIVPNLDKVRIPYQERCLLDIDGTRFLELITEDFSKNGIAIAGLTEPLKNNTLVRINLKLPGMDDAQWLTARVAWNKDSRAGLEIDKIPKQIELVNRSVTYYLNSNNLMKVLHSASAKRSLRKALTKQLPNYMVPNVFSILSEFPMTINGKIDLKSLPPPEDFERLLERKYVLPRTETEKAITTIWSELLQNNKISMTDNFFDLGASSLIVSQLSIRLLEQFNLSVPAAVLIDLPFIPILAEYIDTKGVSFKHKSSVQDEINHDAILSEKILPTGIPSPRKSQVENILLTGAGGFLGIYLLRELLNNTQCKVYCIIRKGEFDTVAKRLISTIQRFHLNKEIDLSNRRIIIIDGDIGLDKMGLSPQQYDSLATKIDCIYHCGAQVNTMASYSTLRGSNVLGTLEIIKFATYKMDKSIHYISTLSSAYKLNESGEYDEVFPDANPDQLVGGYAISKWVSERLLKQIKDRGLTSTIFRSGYILGQSDTGITNLNDALLLLLKGCIQLGAAPQWNELIAILPVDFVSRAIVALTLHFYDKSGVYHLDHPQGIMWADLINWLNNYGYKIKLIPHKEWRSMLTTITADNALYHFLPQYLSMQEGPNTPRTSVKEASADLKTLNIAYPDINDDLLGRYVDYLCEVKFFPQTGKKASNKIT